MKRNICDGHDQVMVLGDLRCLGGLLIWIIIRQGPTVLTASASENCLDIFISPIGTLFFLSLSGKQLDTDCNIVVVSLSPKNDQASNNKKLCDILVQKYITRVSRLTIFHL